MRINKFVAQASGLSRRAADRAIQEGQVLVNNGQPDLGYEVRAGDLVTLDGHELNLPETALTIMLNKPKGYICSRTGQGNQTIYSLLPSEYLKLKPIGRLDKDSSGLLLLTNNGQLAYELTHPKFEKNKIYEVDIDKPLSPRDQRQIEQGVKLQDGISKLALVGSGKSWVVTMSEGRNRQIRRTFASLGYGINRLHRTRFGSYTLDDLALGKFKTI